MGMWVALALGGMPIIGLILWWWNELWYVLPLRLRRSPSSTAKLPPGHMGLPFLGEILPFLWYLKVLRRPDRFIDAKRAKYGDGVGMYRTYLFRSPSIITCFPEVSKFVLQSDAFFLEWPSVELMGRSSLVAVQGTSHARLRSYVTDAINRPDALRRITQLVQPRLIALLESWAQKGRITALDEVKKVTFQNIGKLFASLEPGPLLDTIDNLFEGLVKGVRAQPFNIPGTAYHHALQCRKKLEAIFWKELEKKQNLKEKVTIDLMDGLMQIEDDDGNKLSDQEVIDNIVSLVVAGYSSTSLASMWAIYYLAKFPNVLQKLQEENMAIHENKQEDFITSEDVSKMVYTKKVVEETIRLANIAQILFRTAAKDVEYKGYKIPKGWKVLLFVRYLHTNSENFDDPMCFNPDRWNDPAKPGTYLVFGGGARICAGNMLVRIQLAILLHHLSTGYRWKLLNPDAEMTYLPHPMPIDRVQISINKI